MPSPSSTGATSTRISSSSPASRHCFATFAPSTLTYRSPGGLLRQLHRRLQVAGEADVGIRGVGGGSWVSTIDGPCHLPAERTLGVRALVRVVAGEGPVPDRAGRRCSAISSSMSSPESCSEAGALRADVRAQPRHVATGAGDEAVEGHRRGVEELAHAPVLAPWSDTSPCCASTMVHFRAARVGAEAGAMASTGPPAPPRRRRRQCSPGPTASTLGVAAALILAEAALELARPWPLKLVVDQGLEPAAASLAGPGGLAGSACGSWPLLGRRRRGRAQRGRRPRQRRLGRAGRPGRRAHRHDAALAPGLTAARPVAGVLPLATAPPSWSTGSPPTYAGSRTPSWPGGRWPSPRRSCSSAPS